jgi:hypothetical protein
MRCGFVCSFDDTARIAMGTVVFVCALLIFVTVVQLRRKDGRFGGP